MLFENMHYSNAFLFANEITLRYFLKNISHEQTNGNLAKIGSNNLIMKAKLTEGQLCKPTLLIKQAHLKLYIKPLQIIRFEKIENVDVRN